MERQRFRRMGLVSILSFLAGKVAPGATNQADLDFARTFFRGGYHNAQHGWEGKRRKLKPSSKGRQPRRSKAQRQARARL